MVLKRLRDFFKLGQDDRSESSETSKNSGEAIQPRHFGELWGEIQKIAEEETPNLFSKKSAAEHAGESLEGKKDVERWLHAYMKRIQPDYDYQFPSHHPRYRGLCLIVRQWPSGTLWEAFNEETLLKAPIHPFRQRNELEEAIDEFLDGGES